MNKRRYNREPHHAGDHPADPDLGPEPLVVKHRGSFSGWAPRWADRAAAAAGELLALALPVECVCCGAEDRALCAACAARLRTLTRRPFRAEARAPALMDIDGSVLLPVVAAGVYRGELAQCLLSFKRHGQQQLAVTLATPLAKALAASAGPAPRLLLIPVPTSGAAFRRRGFSPVHLLLAHALRSPHLEGAAVADVLRKAGPGGLTRGLRPTGTAPTWLRPNELRPKELRLNELGQKGLGRAARARRVHGSMRVRGGLRRPELTGRACIIVDDVLTTGATLAEAARALGAAGAVVRGAVVLAATRPPVGGGFASTNPVPAPDPRETGNNKPKKDE